MAAVIIHGGAWDIPANLINDTLNGCRDALEFAVVKVEKHHSALDVVEETIMILENNPLFVAGTGSFVNTENRVEMDAIIIDGVTSRFGSVGAIMNVKNPIKIARKVMTNSDHCMLVGRGALKFACSQGIPEIEDAELQPFIPAGVKKNGTVGVVVLDKNGNLAAGTSSGGVYPKLPGRVGDSAIIGCGAYCNSTCGVSVSGEGEKILQVQLARNAADRIRSQEPMIAAKESIIDFSTRTSGFAGLIAIDSNGRIGYSFNTQNMAIGFWNEKCGKNIKC